MGTARKAPGESPAPGKGEVLGFEPQTVFRRAIPGEVSITRNITHVRRVLEDQGLEIFEVEGDLLGAVTGHSHRDGSPTSRTYWDEQGRVVRMETFGDYGPKNAEMSTIEHEFDEKGRLSHTFQTLHSEEEPSQAIRSSRYEYFPGRPDNEYTMHSTEGGVTKTYTFEQGQEVLERHRETGRPINQSFIDNIK